MKKTHFENQVSILPKVYGQLFCSQITKAQKDTNDLTVFYAFGIFARKSCTQNIREIDHRSQILLFVEF